MNTFLMKNDLPGHGEDSAYVCEDFAVVCDGLGGSGHNTIIYGGEERTEAQTASSLCVLGVRDFLENGVAEDWKTFMAENLSPDDRKEYLEEMTYALRHHIIRFMKKSCDENGVDPESIKALPTTLALALFFETTECTEVTAIWAGDSRVYTVSPTGGLQQLSRDDTVSEEFDANEQIGTSTMAGCVTVTTRFNLNFLHHRLEKAPDRLVFCCSDGCFDGLKSIMLLEYILLDKLMELDDDAAPESFIEDVRSAYLLGEVYGGGLIDDTSMAGRIFGVTDVRQLKKDYLARYANLKEIHEIINDWQAELLSIYENSPSEEADEDIFERFGDFAVRSAVTALEDKPGNWEELILSEAVAKLPVFERFIARRSELIPRTPVSALAEDERLSEVRAEFEDAYLKLLCFSRENREYAFGKIDMERGLAAQLGSELDSFARQLELREEYCNMRDDLLDALSDIKDFFDIFGDGTASRREFLEALSDTVGEISGSADLSYRLLNTDHGMDEDMLESTRMNLIGKLDDSGINGDGFATWYDMGMPPFGDDRNYEVLEQLTGQLDIRKELDPAAEKELIAMLRQLVKKSSDKITEQFLRSPAIIYSTCLDRSENIAELRDWLASHMNAEKLAETAYEQVGKIWRFHYKSMYEQYKKAQTGGKG